MERDSWAGEEKVQGKLKNQTGEIIEKVRGTKEREGGLKIASRYSTTT
jgi:hypothetical protein